MMLKKIFSFVILAGVLTMIAIGSIKADTLQVDSILVPDDYSTVHFASRGNDFQGLLVLKGETILATGENVVLSGETKVCLSQLKGYYFNSQRGNRWRPLDASSLVTLQGLNSSYSGLVLSGGFFTRCSGDSANYVYGQITHVWRGTTFKLLGGMDYNFLSGTYLSSYSGSLVFTTAGNHYAVNNYIYDTNGGIGYLVSDKVLYQGNTSLTGSVGSGSTVTLPGNSTYVYLSGSSNYFLISGNQFLVTGEDWNGVVVPPTLAIGTGAANYGEVGLPDGPILFSIQAGATGTSLSGMFVIDLYVPLGLSGKVLFLYRSQDGNIWTGNTPDTTCTLDANKHCVFGTDHLSFFAGVGSACTGAPANASYTDPITCTWSCNSSYILSGSNCIALSYNGGGGSYRLVKDNCKYSAAAKYNLPGANDLGKDYSRSYYDRDCGDPSDEKIKVDTMKINYLTNFSTELNDAYVYAYAKFITTKDTIDDANMNGPISRRELAKMISEYAVKVVGLEPTTKKACTKFSDIKTQTEEMKFYIKTACELGLMGLESNGTTVASKFNPLKYVSRAQFGTVFSRLLWGDKYNTSLPYYYSSHLAALKTRGIMNDPNPKITEHRGWVMLMMMRADDNQIGGPFHAAAGVDVSQPLFNP